VRVLFFAGDDGVAVATFAARRFARRAWRRSTADERAARRRPPRAVPAVPAASGAARLAQVGGVAARLQRSLLARLQRRFLALVARQRRRGAGRRPRRPTPAGPAPSRARRPSAA
jgi:hypothetical protein